MKTYRARFEKEGRSWIITVPSVPGCHTHAKNIKQGLERIHEALSLFVDGQFEVDHEVVLSDVVARVVEEANSLRAEQDRLQKEAAKTQVKAIRALTGPAHLSTRDAAFLLGISHQRLTQARK